MSSSGVLTLGGTNSYTGGTNIQSGTVRLGADGGLPSTGTVTFGSGTNNGTLDLYGFSPTVAGLTVLGSTPSSQFITNSYTSAGLNPSTLTFSGGASSFGGTIEDGLNGNTVALTVNSGQLTLTNTSPNTYSGTTTLNGGILVISDNNQIGSTTGTIAPLTFNGGTLRYTASSTSTDVSGRTTTFNAGGGTIDLGGNIVTYANPIGNVSPGGGGLTLVDSSAGHAGILTLNGANTYTGATQINSGTLRLGSSGSLTASSAVTVGGTTAPSARRRWPAAAPSTVRSASMAPVPVPPAIWPPAVSPARRSRR